MRLKKQHHEMILINNSLFTETKFSITKILHAKISFGMTSYEPCHEKTCFLYMQKKGTNQLRVTATYKVQSLYLLNPKFQTSSDLLWLYRHPKERFPCSNVIIRDNIYCKIMCVFFMEYMLKMYIRIETIIIKAQVYNLDIKAKILLALLTLSQPHL